MTDETVLTDVDIGVCVCRVYEETGEKEIGNLRFRAHIIAIGRAIEQAVLQSDEVLGLRCAAREYDRLIRHMDAGGDFYEFQRDLATTGKES